MRGLGIGIILTTLILLIANPKDNLSDAKIMERAKELGMMSAKDLENESLSHLLESGKVTMSPSTTPSNLPTQDPTKTPETTKEPDPTKTPEPTKEPEPTKSPEPTKTPTPAIEAPENDNRDGVNTGELITFSVVPGMSSGKVAALLVEKGLINDADDFNQYIVREGKASVIRIGEYTLPMGASYGDIVAMITK